MIDLKRRGFLFGAVAAAVVVPARKYFILPAWERTGYFALSPGGPFLPPATPHKFFVFTGFGQSAWDGETGEMFTRHYPTQEQAEAMFKAAVAVERAAGREPIYAGCMEVYHEGPSGPMPSGAAFASHFERLRDEAKEMADSLAGPPPDWLGLPTQFA